MDIDRDWEGFAELIGAAVVVAGPDGVVRFANRAAKAVFSELLPEHVEVIGSAAQEHDWQFISEDGRQLPLPDDSSRRVRGGEGEVRDEVVGVKVAGGTPRWFLRSLVPVERSDEPGRYDVVSTFVDITARRELEARLEQQVGSDPLTGLANRFRFDERLAEAVARTDPSAGSFALVAVDVDDFKSCNDLHGHGAGDGVLVEVARRLTRVVRDGDTVARIGGDEFVVLVDGAGDVEAHELGQRLIAAFDEPVRPARARRGVELRVTVSVGIAIHRPGEDASVVEQCADDALRAAKRAGKACFVVHDPHVTLGPPVELEVDAADAHAWAAYIGALRSEIARRKAEGRLPATTGAPPSVHRILQEVMSCIELLPASGTCRLRLPCEHDLAPFVFHHGNVNRWVDELRMAGTIVLQESPGAVRFWDQLRAGVAVSGASTDVAGDLGGRSGTHDLVWRGLGA